MSFSSILQDIKSLKIQGAHAVAKAGLQALHIKVLASRASTRQKLIQEFHKAQRELLALRPTEPFLRNLLNYTILDITAQDSRTLKEEFLHKIQSLMKKIDYDQHQIVAMGAQRISPGDVLFTHCHSSTVNNIILAATRQKTVEVHVTESRPVLQGRITAKQLSKGGVSVHYYVDAAAKAALKKADLVLLGADAITSEGNIVNKIGSGLLVEAAERQDIPVYICTHSLKFDALTLHGEKEPLEQRDKKEVWENSPLGVVVHNPAFEVISSEGISGVISELGIFKPGVLVEEVLRTYPWLVA